MGALRKELAQAQAARVQAESERDEARRGLGEAATRLNEALGAVAAELEQAERDRDEARAAAAEYSDHLDGHGTLVGPCPHGSDPWDRCDTCGALNAVQVALLLRDAEKTAREVVEADKAALHEEAVRAAAELRHACRVKEDWEPRGARHRHPGAGHGAGPVVPESKSE